MGQSGNGVLALRVLSFPATFRFMTCPTESQNTIASPDVQLRLLHYLYTHWLFSPQGGRFSVAGAEPMDEKRSGDSMSILRSTWYNEKPVLSIHGAIPKGRFASLRNGEKERICTSESGAEPVRQAA